MPAKVVKPAQPADPTIDQVFEEFLAEQRRRLKPRTLSQYEDVLRLLRRYLNSYAYESLSKEESALFSKHYEAKGENHREFCKLFGPDKIVENLGSFLGYFMIREVIAGQDLKRAAGTVTKKLSQWLAAKEHISGDAAQEGAEVGTEASRDLPKAERNAQVLRDSFDELAIDPNDLPDQDFLEFDHFTIAKVEPGKLWLESSRAGKSVRTAPLSAPETATKLLRKGWGISCSLGRVRGKWWIVEVANVYPE